MKLEVSSQQFLCQALGNCEVDYLPRVGSIRELDLREDVRAVQLSEEDYQKLCKGTYVCCDFLPCRVEEDHISEVALAVRGDKKSVIPNTAWFFGGRNKLLSEPFAELSDSLDVIVNKKGEELRKMMSLEGDYGRGYIEVIKREAGHLCAEVEILPLGVALTRFYDPHQIGLSRYPLKPVLIGANYGRLLSLSAYANRISIRRYPYKDALSPEDCPVLIEHSISAVRSTIQPVVALLLPAEVYDKWIENKTANPGEGILKVIRVTRQHWENDGAIESEGTRWQPLAFVKDVLGEVFGWKR